jgi:Stress responsive A/B Barrel Domain
MPHKTSIAAALAVLVLSAAALAADPVKTTTSVDKTVVPATVHAVVFRMKKDAPADAVEKVVADCHAMLETIPTVRMLKAGRPLPADQATPKVAAQDYDVALVIFFDDAAGLKTYLEHETHLAFVKKHGQYFDMEKLQVFDFGDQKK